MSDQAVPGSWLFRKCQQGPWQEGPLLFLSYGSLLLLLDYKVCGLMAGCIGFLWLVWHVLVQHIGFLLQMLTQVLVPSTGFCT